jgi:hypothetical protein
MFVPGHRSSPLVALGLSLLSEQLPDLDEPTVSRFCACVSQFVTGDMPYEASRRIATDIIGPNDIISRLNEILTVPDVPIPNESPKLNRPTASGRSQTRTWSPEEDTRLLAAMHKYSSTESFFWPCVAQFVGNGRTRSQCAQRWTRVLDPRICKRQWTPQEDELLIRLVATHGEHAWMKVSADLKHRSDVQCRYRYAQLQRFGQCLPNPEPVRHALPEVMVTAKTQDAGATSVFMVDPPFHDAEELPILLSASMNLNRSDSLFDSSVWLFNIDD